MAKSFKTGITADGTVSATSLAVTGEFTLPTADGSADQVLVTNGSGTVTWSDQSGGGLTVSDTAPGSPSAGDLWFESDTGKTFVYYNDGSSSQWIEVGAASAAASGNDGAVQFSAGGALSSDTTNFYWDDTNNRLGIGTTSPGYDLEVDGTLAITNESTSLISNNGSTGREVLQMRARTGTGDGAGINLYGDSDASHAGKAFIYSGGSATFTVDGDNVGIGTTSPETPLNIVTANKLGSTFTGTTDGEGLRVDQSNYTSGNYVSLVESSYIDSVTAPHVRVGAMYDGGGSNLAFGTSNNYGSGITNTAMFIDSDGNVGIGTTSPAETLHVEGDMVLKDTSPTLNIKDSDSTGASNGSMVFRDSADTVLGRIQMNGNDDLGIQAVGAASTMFLYAYGDWRMSLVSSGLRPYVDNSFDLGATSKRYDDIYATNGTIQTSDERDKTDVANIDYGLTFVNSLRPVTYRWNDRSGYTGTRTHMGFIAQEVETALGDDAATRAVWVDSPAGEYKNADTGEMEPGVERQSLRYEEMIAPMVKAIQELSATVQTLTDRIETLEAE